MYHTSYLIHYNKNHSKANGQFVSGDSDGDGIVNDHANQRRSQTSSRKVMTRSKARAIRNSGIALLASAASMNFLGQVAMHEDNKTLGLVAAYGSVPLAAVGIANTIRGAVSMGKASRRGDRS